MRGDSGGSAYLSRMLGEAAPVMARSASEDFETALDVLAHIATLLADPQATRGHPKDVAVLVEGDLR